jgi:hypothetical protein
MYKSDIARLVVQYACYMMRQDDVKFHIRGNYFAGGLITQSVHVMKLKSWTVRTTFRLSVMSRLWYIISIN